jgi:translation initiation factor 1
MNICPNCGLPQEACICNELTKTSQKIRIETMSRRFGKLVTMITGIEKDSKDVAKKLKEFLACGGTVKNDIIELQGNHSKKAREKLIELGFDEKNIEEIEKKSK